VHPSDDDRQGATPRFSIAVNSQIFILETPLTERNRTASFNSSSSFLQVVLNFVYLGIGTAVVSFLRKFGFHTLFLRLAISLLESTYFLLVCTAELKKRLSSSLVLPEVSCWTTAGERQSARIRSLYLNAVLRQDIAYFDTELTTGQAVSRMSSDTLVIQDALGEKVTVLFSCALRQVKSHFHPVLLVLKKTAHESN
jgi:ABC-type multidrug transport system fused ATPase/permease subunit